MESLIEQDAGNIEPISNAKNLRATMLLEPSSARDRLLAALKSSPALKQEDAEIINSAVKRAREESLIAEISA